MFLRLLIILSFSLSAHSLEKKKAPVFQPVLKAAAFQNFLDQGKTGFVDMAHALAEKLENQGASLEPREQDVLLSKGPIQQRTYTRLTGDYDALSEKEFREYAELVDKIIRETNMFLPTPQELGVEDARAKLIPLSVNVDLVKTFDDAYQQVDTLHLPKTLVLHGLQKHYRKSLGVIRHEYFHDVFSEIMAEKLPAWKKNIEVHVEIDALMKEYVVILNQYKAIRKKLEGTGIGLDEAQRLVNQARDLRTQLAEMEAQSQKLYDKIDAVLSKLAGSYNEFFADVGAVLGSANEDGELNPKVIHQALYFSGLQEHYPVPDRVTGKMIRLKDLKRINKFRDFSKKIKAKNFHEKTIHIALNPTRYHLWKYYLSEAPYRRQRQRLVAKVVLAIADEMRYLHANPKVYEELTVPQMNLRLIKAIDHHILN